MFGDMRGYRRKLARSIAPPFCKGNQHGYPPSVILVVFAQKAHQIVLFKLDPNQYIGRGRHGEQQMPDRHVGRCPERDNEPEHDGMAQVRVEARSLELDVVVLPIMKMLPDLPKAK